MNKNILNSITHKLLNIFLCIVWKKYMEKGNSHSLMLVLKHFVIQKVLRVNHHVNWPVHWTSQIFAPENISRGTRTPGLSIACFIDASNKIIIDENVWIGPKVSIISQNHNNNNFNKYEKISPVIIKKNSLVGAHAVILPGVELGEHTIVAAGAVVTKSFPGGNQVLAGNPAIIIKRIEEYEKDIL